MMPLKIQYKWDDIGRFNVVGPGARMAFADFRNEASANLPLDASRSAGIWKWRPTYSSGESAACR